MLLLFYSYCVCSWQILMTALDLYHLINTPFTSKTQMTMTLVLFQENMLTGPIYNIYNMKKDYNIYYYKLKASFSLFRNVKKVIRIRCVIFCKYLTLSLFYDVILPVSVMQTLVYPCLFQPYCSCESVFTSQTRVHQLKMTTLTPAENTGATRQGWEVRLVKPDI